MFGVDISMIVSAMQVVLQVMIKEHQSCLMHQPT